MINKTIINICVMSTLSILMSSCSSDNSDLSRYINDIKSRPALPIEPIPTFAPLSTFKFPENDTRRSPFKPSDIRKRVDPFAPDQKRIRQPLESFPLDALKFVGTLRRGNEIWALIKDPEKITPIKIGDYMGQNYGRIISITSDQIKLEETVKDTGAWKKQITTLNLDTSK
ncbi:MAG: pilus assembly protein PilP [bacterium]|nr:pilus assembly protein PilP [bacterium]